MAAQDLDEFDDLLLQLRDRTLLAPDRLTANVLSRLGPPARSVRLLFIAGSLVCLVAMVLSATISLRVVRHAPATAPPELTLFSAEVGPLASL